MRKAPVRCFSVPLIAWMAASAATLPVKTYTTADGLAEPFRGKEIARFIGLRSPKTLRRHFREGSGGVLRADRPRDSARRFS